MKYIQMFITNVKEQVMQQSLPTVNILIHLLTIYQIGIVFWVVVEITEIWQYLKKKMKIHHQTKKYIPHFE